MSYSDSLDNITLDSDNILTIERFENNYYNHKNNVLQIGGVYTFEQINDQLTKIFNNILDLIFIKIDLNELFPDKEKEEAEKKAKADEEAENEELKKKWIEMHPHNRFVSFDNPEFLEWSEHVKQINKREALAAKISQSAPAQNQAPAPASATAARIPLPPLAPVPAAVAPITPVPAAAIATAPAPAPAPAARRPLPPEPAPAPAPAARRPLPPEPAPAPAARRPSPPEPAPAPAPRRPTPPAPSAPTPSQNQPPAPPAPPAPSQNQPPAPPAPAPSQNQPPETVAAAAPAQAQTTPVPAAEASKSKWNFLSFFRNTTKPKTPAQTSWFKRTFSSGGGNNKKKLKKNIIRLYNCYILSQNQNGGANNKLSLIIKKRLDKKISELKNLEGGTVSASAVVGADEKRYELFLTLLKIKIKDKLTENSTQINQMFPIDLLEKIFNNKQIREMFAIDLNNILSDDILNKISTMYYKIIYNIIEKIIDEQKIPIQQVYLKELNNRNNNNINLVGGSLVKDIQGIIGTAFIPLALIIGSAICGWEIITKVPGMITGLGKAGQTFIDAVKAVNIIPSFNPRTGRPGLINLNFNGYV